MTSTSPTVSAIDTYQIKCAANPLAPRLIQFTPWELRFLSVNYIQKGLLYAKPPHLSFEEIFELLKDSLEETLHHFYPFSGRLKVTCDGEATSVELELVPGSDGAEIIQAVAERVTVADVASYYSQDSPEVLKELFPLDGAVTELSDGVFVGCALNVMVADGTSIWHFWNSWAEIARAKAAGIEYVLSQPPVHEKFFIDGFGDPPIKLPFSSPTQFIERSVSPPIRERLFHFSPESIARLKARANQECAEVETGIILKFPLTLINFCHTLCTYLGEPPRLLAGSNRALQYATVAKSHFKLLGSILGTPKAAENAILYSYTQHINGFAAMIDEETANKISKLQGVVSVFPSKAYQLHTTRSWEFLGLESDGYVNSNSLWKKAGYGKDTIIGNLDTAGWGGHPYTMGYALTMTGGAGDPEPGRCRRTDGKKYCDQKNQGGEGYVTHKFSNANADKDLFSLLECFTSIAQEIKWKDVLNLNSWVVRDYYRLVSSVNSLEPQIQRLSDEQGKGNSERAATAKGKQ
ncbi:Subtilisin-like protease SBT5.3 [Carex littledalei]|uniref:Subtilisin-like protease SBT5.3 n=1 Tax=Carex littledalei TaxID=544730 RepID=A0A833RKC5_9POAL|nr:Subtilisin-like protease SBT5.3 [Carex littledalei]